MELGERLGSANFYKYFRQFGLLSKTQIDLPGEAATIMHAEKNIGPVELATISFGQSFQITPMQLATTVSTLVNGGKRITPHLGVRILNEKGKTLKTFAYEDKTVLSKQTSETMQQLLESVVSEGTGRNAAIEGYEIGGKTATSQTLPRSANKYISSFVGFAQADNPQILGLVVIHNPKGIYYGGTIAAPVIRTVFENVLPYLGIEKVGE
jgi:stage V sporulation protein D (sporulation-specific penicillin-binding protein)